MAELEKAAGDDQDETSAVLQRDPIRSPLRATSTSLENDGIDRFPVVGRYRATTPSSDPSAISSNCVIRTSPSGKRARITNVPPTASM